MSDIVLRTTARTQVAAVDLAHRLAQHFSEVAERARRGESGQDVIEYAGMVILVCGIIFALTQLPIAGTVKSSIKNALDSIGIKV
jgi:phosphoribosylcarboxyaminoimidazole (NCAIR) mutase